LHPACAESGIAQRAEGRRRCIFSAASPPLCNLRFRIIQNTIRRTPTNTLSIAFRCLDSFMNMLFGHQEEEEDKSDNAKMNKQILLFFKLPEENQETVHKFKQYKNL
jgi:hypothetical protein